ncbi:costars family protein ABRACL [Platysternon megacephalum]|uniref:Costars family protein ABRACL n=1 Tax=Platysternon megacephalum TaxID=55544 RepID=A0A4D9ERA5_9SAUR|nr:costars family protein ABRACL [Platysternon megacephalum]
MGVREGGTALSGGPGASAVSIRCIGVLVVLLFGIWEAKAQSEFETSPVYLWKTGFHRIKVPRKRRHEPRLLSVSPQLSCIPNML